MCSMFMAKRDMDRLVNKGKSRAVKNKDEFIEIVNESQKAPDESYREQKQFDLETRIPTSAFMGLLKRGEEKPQKPPQNFFIQKMVCVGDARPGFVNLSVNLEIDVLSEHWTTVPLFSKSVALSSASVKYKGEDGSSSHQEGEDDSFGYLGAVRSGYCFVAARAGHYEVSADVLCEYLTKTESGFTVNTPLAARTFVTFSVPQTNVQVKVDPCISQQENSSDESTKVEAKVPPTTELSVQWTERVEMEEAEMMETEKYTGPPVFDSTIKSLFSIGEGVLSATTRFDLLIKKGGISRIDVTVPRNVRVLSVKGSSIKKWNLVKRAQDGPEELKIILDYGLEDSYDFVITSEREIEDGTAEFYYFNVRSAKKELAYVAVEAKSNIELAEATCENLIMISVGELPSTLSSLAVDSILFAYKATSPQYTLSFDVTKNEDVEVLVSTISSAHFVLTCSEEGIIMAKLICQMANSVKQFMKCQLPENSEVLSATVSENLAKPSINPEGDVMIPLLKYQGRDKTAPFLMSLSFLLHTVDMRNHSYGKLELPLPKLDVPINYLAVTLHVPVNYNFGEFTGMKEVKQFSREVLQDRDVANQPLGGQSRARHMKAPQRNLQVAQSNIGINVMQTQTVSFSKLKRKNVGIAPVHVDIPISKRVFRFEQLVVMDADLSLSVDFMRREKGFFKRRKLYPLFPIV